MNPSLIVSLAILGGFSIPFAFAPFDYLALAVLGMGGWLLLLKHYPQYACRLGFGFGFGWFGLGAWWLANTLQIYGHLPYVLGLLAVALLGLMMGFFMAGWARLMVFLQRKPIDWLWLFPVVGVLVEWLRSFVLTGLPWTALGNLILLTPATSWVSVVGSYGATFLMLLCISAMTLLCYKNTRVYASIVLGCCILVLSASPEITVPIHPRQSVALVQPNIAQNHKWDAEFLNASMMRLTRLSEESRDADLIIWPETAVPMVLSKAPSWDRWLQQQMQSWQTPVVFGGMKVVKDEATQALKLQNGLFLAQQGEQERQFVGKHHLVPFGEYVPSWLPWLNQLIPEIGDFQPATDNGILYLAGQKLGTLICYESIFPDEAAARVKHGADVLIVVTNDAWYDQSPAAWQHLQASQMRALETGRYVLRATNTGVSAIIAPDGRIQQSIAWWQAGVVRGHYEPLTHLTLYQQWGDAPVLLLMLFMLCWGGYRKYRSQR